MAGCPLPLKLQKSQASKQSAKIDQRDICEHIPLKPGTDEALYPSGRPRPERVRAQFCELGFIKGSETGAQSDTEDE